MNYKQYETDQYPNKIHTADEVSVYINLDFAYRPTLVELVNFLNNAQQGKTAITLRLLSRGAKGAVALNKKTIFLDDIVMRKIKELFPKALILLTFENHKKTKREIDQVDIDALESYLDSLNKDVKKARY